MSRSQHTLRSIAREPYGPAMISFIVCVGIGVVVVTLGDMFGLLPFSGPAKLRNPCPAAAALAPDRPDLYGKGGRARAWCRTRTSSIDDRFFTSVEIDVKKNSSADPDHRRGCEALAGIGAIEEPADLGDAACASGENGLLRSAVILVRRDDISIRVQYATNARDAATVRRVAVETARRVTASL